MVLPVSHGELSLQIFRLAGLHIGSKHVLAAVGATLAHRSNGKLMNNLLGARTLKSSLV